MQRELFVYVCIKEFEDNTMFYNFNVNLQTRKLFHFTRCQKMVNGI